MNASPGQLASALARYPATSPADAVATQPSHATQPIDDAADDADADRVGTDATATAAVTGGETLSEDEQRRLVEEHLALVRAIAARMIRKARTFYEYDDLVSIGTLALIEAASRFDPSRGFKFSTFAYLRVSGAMTDSFGRAAPHSRGVARRRAGRPERELPPFPYSFDEGHHRPAMLDESDAYASTRVAGQIDDALDARRYAASLCDALDSLDPATREVILRHYFAEQQLQDISRVFGRSKSWATRTHASGIMRLRKAMEKSLRKDRLPLAPRRQPALRARTASARACARACA